MRDLWDYGKSIEITKVKVNRPIIGYTCKKTSAKTTDLYKTPV